ncbi:MAG: ABC transporter ATP-binding protein [Syntrophomonadaceae bacterium]|nr:ABC transporter ATP-binding protein [Syntrophomonadaceae bacterium]
MEPIRIENLEHTFHMGRLDVQVLYGVNLAVKEGEFLSLCGSSGSGKTTLLNLIGGLMKPTGGMLKVNGHDITNYSENQLCHFRRGNLGFIFQSYNLLPALTALDNVALPLIFAGVKPEQRRERAEAILVRVGLEDRLHHHPDEMSGGQQQRVAIARALVSHPPIILADEPTGNLDTANGEEIMALMREINQTEGKTIIMVTHDPEKARRCDRVIYLRDGHIVNEEVTA